jgi:hypothetical protein
MLAEVFVLRLEALLRASREPTTGDTRFASNKLLVTGKADEIREDHRSAFGLSRLRSIAAIRTMGMANKRVSTR